MVKRKWRGRRPAGEQSRKLTQNDQAPERPGSPPQQVETEAQPAEPLNATQVDLVPVSEETPIQTPAQEEKARRAKRSRDRTETRAIFILFAGSFSSKLLKKEMHTIAVLLLFVYL